MAAGALVLALSGTAAAAPPLGAADAPKAAPVPLVPSRDASAGAPAGVPAATAQAPAEAPAPSRNRVRWIRAPGAAEKDKDAEDLAPTQNASLTAPRPARRPTMLQAATAAAMTGSAAPRTAALAPAVLPGTPDGSILLGVMNLSNGRSALMRMPDGAIRKVKVGDTLDGWRISSIASDAIRLSRNGKDRTMGLVGR